MGCLAMPFSFISFTKLSISAALAGLGRNLTSGQADGESLENLPEAMKTCFRKNCPTSSGESVASLEHPTQIELKDSFIFFLEDIRSFVIRSVAVVKDDRGRDRSCKCPITGTSTGRRECNPWYGNTGDNSRTRSRGSRNIL